MPAGRQKSFATRSFMIHIASINDGPDLGQQNPHMDAFFAALLRCNFTPPLKGVKVQGERSSVETIRVADKVMFDKVETLCNFELLLTFLRSFRKNVILIFILWTIQLK